jgi:antibiotic biosynthesis monooxygenase (ABM) superfamily enzyme
VSPSGPVTVIVARRPIVGREADYERWIDGIAAASSRFPGHVNTQVIRPASGHREYITIIRFASVEDLRTWQGSAERREHLEALDGLVESDASVAKVEGLDVWLDALGDESQDPRARFRSTLLVSLVVYVMILLISPPAEWLLPDVHPKARLFVAVLVQVFTMSYLVMPSLTRWLDAWLHPGRRAPRAKRG